MTKENSEQIQPLLDLLTKIKYQTKLKFPKAQDFIRPGFDEIVIEMVM